MDATHWFKNAIIYHIFIDRFAGFTSMKNWEKPEFLGGTIQGIINKLSYLKDLGVTTLWISPFYQTTAYHGYHITDFYHVDHHFGTIEDVQDLITQVHEQNMTIIADFVPNHCSRHHPYFKEAQQDKNSDYHDWFYFTHWPDTYRCFLSVREIPKINLNNPQARDHIINAAKKWLKLGFDGFRLDHVIGPPHSFWNYFKHEIKHEFPHAVLIGEAWMMGIKLHELNTINIKNRFFKWLFSSTTTDKLLQEYIGELDGVLDFHFQEIIQRYIQMPQQSQKHLIKTLNRHYRQFPQEYFLPTFLDNHDMDRFLFKCGNDTEKLKIAAEIQFSINQPAIIYYGTETGITQTQSLWDVPVHGDLQARQPMNWESPDDALVTFYTKLIHQKKHKINQ